MNSLVKEWKTLFLKEPERVGLEIEGRSVRVARVVESEGRPALASFGDLEMDIWHASEMERHRLKSAIRQIGGGLQRVGVNMEHPSLKIRRMVLARMPEGDTMEAIRWNFREQVDGPISDYIVGYTPLEGFSEGGRVALMAFGVSKEATAEIASLLKGLGLKVASIEPSATAILAAFHVNGALNDGGRHASVSFGEATTLFTVMMGRSLLFSRPLAGINGEGLVKLVMRNLNLDEPNARESLSAWMRKAADREEAAKPEEEEGDLDRKIGTTMGLFLSQMVIEVQRSIDAFCIMYNADRIDRIHLCGSGVMYPGLVEHMQKTLGIEAEAFNPFEKLLPRERQTPEVVRRAPLYAVSVGLAIA